MDKKANHNFIREVRIKRGLTQKELAEMIDVPPEYISKMERGVMGITSDNYLRLSIALNVTINYLMTGKTLFTSTKNVLPDALATPINNIIEKGAKDDLKDLFSGFFDYIEKL